ncbi:MAG: glycosyltransferase family 4 protein [Gemmatimonadota bacterium]|nr:glycosyltransferase family 4 protein [Gemmatimonadota bacterium]
MKVFFFTEGTAVSPASRIRVYEYLERLGGEGRVSARAVSFTSPGYCRRIVAGKHTGRLRKIPEKIYQLWAVLRLVAGSALCDVVFIQRVLLPVFMQKLVRLVNRRIIYDFDDAVYLGRGGSRKPRFESQVRLCSRVVAVSRAAAGEAVSAGASPRKVTVVPSAVDCRAYRTRESSGKEGEEGFTVGWIGSPDTTRFLEAVWPELARFASEHPEVSFLFIGAEPFDTGSLADRAAFAPWSPRAERHDLCRLDAGLMPLEDNPWCRGKGGYKLIQYMAGGAACLASPVGANLEIIEEGVTGFFARSLSDWRTLLEKLLANRPLCERLGREGRLKAENEFDYKITTPILSGIIEAC